MKKTKRARGNKFDLLRSIEEIKKRFMMSKGKDLESYNKSLSEEVNKLINYMVSNRCLPEENLNHIRNLLNYLIDEIVTHDGDNVMRDINGKIVITHRSYLTIEGLLRTYLYYPKKETLDFVIDLYEKTNELSPSIKRREFIEKESIRLFNKVLSTAISHPIQKVRDIMWFTNITESTYGNCGTYDFMIPCEVFNFPENNFEKFVHFLKANLSAKYLYDKIINAEYHDNTYYLLEFIERVFTPNAIDLARGIPNRSIKDIKLQEMILKLIDNSSYDSGNSIRSIELTSLLLTKLDLKEDVLIQYLTNLYDMLMYTRDTLPHKGHVSTLFGTLENLPSYYKSRIWDLTGIESIIKSVNYDILRLFDISRLGSYVSEKEKIELENRIIKEDLRSVRWINLIDNKENRKGGPISKTTYLRLMDNFRSTVNDPKFRAKIKEIKYNKSRGMKGLAELRLSVNERGKSVIKILKVADELYPQIVEELIDILLNNLQFKVSESSSSIGIIRLT